MKDSHTSASPTIPWRSCRQKAASAPCSTALPASNLCVPPSRIPRHISLTSRLQRQHPCSYDPRVAPCTSRSNRRGTFGTHHDQDAHIPEMSERLQCQVDRERQASQLHESWRLKHEHPGPMKYSPIVDGQFPPAYTTLEIAAAAAHNQRHQQATVEKAGNAVSVETLGLALGPGSYDIDRDVSSPHALAFVFLTPQAVDSHCFAAQSGAYRDPLHVRPGQARGHPRAGASAERRSLSPRPWQLLQTAAACGAHREQGFAIIGKVRLPAAVRRHAWRGRRTRSERVPIA